MTHARKMVALALVAGAAGWTFINAEKHAAGQSAPATLAAAAGPATAPATQPEAVAVRRGSLALDLRLEGTLQPVEPFEVRLKFKAHQESPLVVKAAAPGAAVKKGDLLLECDARRINWAVRGAKSELAVAEAALRKAESDVALAEKADALALRMQEDDVKDAVEARQWWEKLEGPQSMLAQELTLKRQQDGVDDQNDELDQLRKMYKSEQLTSATADIVVKRALRGYELGKIYLKMAGDNLDKYRKYDYPIADRKTVDTVTIAKNKLEALKAAQANALVTRTAALEGAKIALEQATQKLDNLKADQALFVVTAPADGVVAYGQWTEGGWVGGDPRALRAGEALTAGSVVMRVYQPGQMRIECTLSDDVGPRIPASAKARVIPASLPYAAFAATCAQPQLAPRGNPGPLGYKLTADLADADTRLLPGMKATLRISQPMAENVLILPLSAVEEGQVSVRTPAGQWEKRPVQVGRCDGKNVEILSGVSEGDQVQAGGK